MTKTSKRSRPKVATREVERLQDAPKQLSVERVGKQKQKPWIWLVVEILSTATLVGWLFWVSAINRMKLVPLPMWLQIVVVIAFGIAISLHNFVLPKLLLSGEYHEDPRVASLVHSADRFASALSASALVLATVFTTGAHIAALRWIKQRIPELGGQASEYLAVALGMAVSGVVGNAAYDLLRKALRKLG